MAANITTLNHETRNIANPFKLNSIQMLSPNFPTKQYSLLHTNVPYMKILKASTYFHTHKQLIQKKLHTSVSTFLFGGKCKETS